MKEGHSAVPNVLVKLPQLLGVFGYENFFIWVLICAVPGFIIVKFLPLDPEFGKKKE